MEGQPGRLVGSRAMAGDDWTMRLGDSSREFWGGRCQGSDAVWTLLGRSSDGSAGSKGVRGH
jgi:hypothetical protein